MSKRLKRVKEHYSYTSQIQPKNEKQKEYINLLNDYSIPYVFSCGPAGCGKTLLATEKAIENWTKKSFNKIIITRPAVEVDENHGFLPGDLNEKMQPWMRPLLDIFKNHFDVSTLEYLIKNEKIEIAPLAYLRGRTFDYSWIIADEMQNSTENQMKMLLTRLGKKSKMVLTGDLKQHDKRLTNNGLLDIYNKIKRHPTNSVRFVEFSNQDIERSPHIKEILSLYGEN